MSTIERLTAEQYDVLKGIEEGYRPDPESSVALIAKSGDEIVGRMLLIAPAHIEGTWVKEGFRNGTVGIRMMRRMETEAVNINISRLFAYAEDIKVEEYLARLGFKRLPVTVWVKDLCH